MSKTPPTASSSQPSPSNGRLEVLDYVRGLAIIHIFLYHYYIEWFQGSFLIIPDGVAANIPRLQIFHDGGLLDILKNLFSFLWVYGFTSVNLFLLLSGFVLTYSALKSKSEIRTGGELLSFYVKKLKRLLVPFYITLLLGIAILFLRNLLYPSFSAMPIYSAWDVLKTLFVPFLVYDLTFLQKFNGDLWFITLILQLYIIFPVLYYALKKYGVWRFIAACFMLTVAYRYVATYYLDTAPMGVIFPATNSYRLFSFFLPRLFEFGLGMSLGYWQFKDSKTLETLRGGWQFLTAVAIMLVGFSLNMYRGGWPLSDAIISIGLFATLLNIGAFFARISLLKTLMLKLSESSYEIYLLHHYLLNYLLMPLLIVLGIKNELGFWLGVPVFFIISTLVGMGGQRLSTLFYSLTNTTSKNIPR
ncbi:MAG: acyltransferase [Candidatus Peregrinibacteria bacterium]|nr:acyltransferase [Candidatus Peregrinibacteria bacterium]